MILYIAALWIVIWSSQNWGPWLWNRAQPLRVFKRMREAEKEASEWRDMFKSGNFWIVLSVARKSVKGKVGDALLINEVDSEDYPDHMKPRDLAEKYNELRRTRIGASIRADSTISRESHTSVPAGGHIGERVLETDWTRCGDCPESS